MTNFYQENEIEDRQWGSFKVLFVGPLFTCKTLLIKPHKSISLQTHKHRSEHWIVCSGTATVQLGRTIFKAEPNKYIFVEPNQPHCLANETDEELVIIEVQYGDRLDENDIDRMMYTMRWPIKDTDH